MADSISATVLMHQTLPLRLAGGKRPGLMQSNTKHGRARERIAAEVNRRRQTEGLDYLFRIQDSFRRP